MSRPANDFYERIKHRLHERIGRHLRLAGTVVDMGCGACDLVEYLAQTYRQKVIGVDISPDSFPSRRSTRAGVLFQCVAADATRIDFTRENSVDAIVSMWALHEMKHPEAILAEALRILRPGGELLIVDFPRGSLAQELWDENYYTLKEVEQLVAKSGFAQVRGRPVERKQVMWITGHCPIPPQPKPSQ